MSFRTPVSVGSFRRKSFIGSFRRPSLKDAKAAIEAVRAEEEAEQWRQIENKTRATNSKLESRRRAAKSANGQTPKVRRGVGGGGTELARIHHSSAIPSSALSSPPNFVTDDDTRVGGVGITFWVAPSQRGAQPGRNNEEDAGGFDIVVLSVDPDGPADQGILRKGDKLISVDGRGVRGKDWSVVGPQVEGPVGTSVHLAFERRGGAAGKERGAVARRLAALASGNFEAVSIRVLRGGQRVIRVKTVWPDPDVYTRNSCFAFGHRNKMRRVCILLCESPLWTQFILLCILASTVLLALLDPLDTPERQPNSRTRDNIEIASKCFTVLFAFEACVNIIAHGFFFGKSAYMKSTWNLLDFFVVIIGLLDFFPQSGSSVNLLALRSLRVLRPLRAIKRLPALKMCVTVIFQGGGDVLNGLAVVLFVAIVFAIAGVQLLSGQLRNRCFHVDLGTVLSGVLCQGVEGAFVQSLSLCPPRYDCLRLARGPLNGLIHFDHIGGAVQGTVQVLMLEGWTQIMYDVLDVYNPTFVIFFVLLVLVGPLFAMHLFVAVLANTLTKVSDTVKINRMVRAVCHWKHSHGIARAFNAWELLLLQRMQQIAAHVREVIEDNAVNRRRARAVLVRWFNLAVLKAWNMWRASYMANVRFEGNLDVMDAHRGMAETAAGEHGGGGQSFDMDEIRRRKAGEKTAALPKWLPTWAMILWELYQQLLEQYRRFKLWLRKVAAFSRSQGMEQLSQVVVGLNTLGMTLDHTRDSTLGSLWRSDRAHALFHAALDVLNMFVIIYFCAEFLFKLWGFGVRPFFRLKRNLFDTFLVGISVPEFPGLLTSYRCKLGATRLRECASVDSFSVLRLLRLVRVVKLLRAFPNFQAQWQVAMDMLAEIFASFGLLCIFLAVYTILGMSLFGGAIQHPPEQLGPAGLNLGSRVYVQLPDDPLIRPAFVSAIDRVAHPSAPWRVKVVNGWQSNQVQREVWAGFSESARRSEAVIAGVAPRTNFDTLLNSLVSVFQVLGGSGWPSVMATALRAMGDVYMLYFYSLIVIGNIVLFNLFRAVIVVAFRKHTRKMENAAAALDGPRVPDLAVERTKTKDRRGGWGALLAWCRGKKEARGERGPAPAARRRKLEDGEEPDEKPQMGAVVWKAERQLAAEARAAYRHDEEHPVHRLHRRRRKLKGYVKGVVVDYVDGEGYRVLYEAESVIGTAWEEWVHGIELQELRNEQQDLHIVQSELRLQQTLTATALGQHLSRNLDRALDLLQARVDALRSHEDRLRRWEELQSEVHRATASNRMGRVIHLLDRADLSQPVLLTSPAADAPHAPAEPRAAPDREAALSPHEHQRQGRLAGSVSQQQVVVQKAQRLAAEREAARGERRERGVNLNDIAALADPAFKGPRLLNVAHFRQEVLRLEEVMRGIRQRQTALTAGVLTGRSCGCLGPLHPLRQRAAKVIQHQDFERVLNICILASCVSLATERPQIPSSEQQGLDLANIVFSAVFLGELVLKVVALGFTVYLQSGWNRLDLLIAVASIIDIVLTYAVSEIGDENAKILRIIKIFRIFRALRPLRVLLRSEGLRVIVRAVTDSMWPILAAFAMSVMCFVAFGIVGMQVMAGSMHYCSDASVFLEEDCVGTLPTGEVRRWLNSEFNFDWIGKAVMAVLVVAMQDDWQRILFAAVDGTNEGQGPVQNNRQWLFLYFFIVILIAAFFQINMWTGVFVDVYFRAAAAIEAEMESGLGRDASQRRRKYPRRKDLPFLEAADASAEARAGRKFKSSELRLHVYRIAMSPKFDQLIAAGIVLNVACMTLESYRPTADQVRLQEVGNLFFTFVFGLEVALKGFALYPRRFFRDAWLRFDMFITLISFLGLSVELSGITFGFNPTILRILRIFRVIRIIKAAKIFRHIKRLLQTIEALLQCMPIVSNLLALLLLLLLIFGVTGVVLFGHLCIEGEETLPGPKGVRCTLLEEEWRLGRYANSQNSAMSALALFRVTTGESWSVLMEQTKLDVSEFPRQDDALEDAAQWLTLWNASDDKILRTEYMDRARKALPGCMTVGELEFLRERKLADCSKGDDTPFRTPCQTTCGNLFSQAFFPAFLCLSNLMLINLALAAVTKQLSMSTRDPLESSFITKNLPKHTFIRIVEVWRTNSSRLRRFHRMLERYNKVTILRDVQGSGQILSLRKGEVCTLLGYWELKSHVVLKTAEGLQGICPLSCISNPIPLAQLTPHLHLRPHEVRVLEGNRSSPSLSELGSSDRGTEGEGDLEEEKRTERAAEAHAMLRTASAEERERGAHAGGSSQRDSTSEGDSQAADSPVWRRPPSQGGLFPAREPRPAARGPPGDSDSEGPRRKFESASELRLSRRGHLGAAHLSDDDEAGGGSESGPADAARASDTTATPSTGTLAPEHPPDREPASVGSGSVAGTPSRGGTNASELSPQRHPVSSGLRGDRDGDHGDHESGDAAGERRPSSPTATAEPAASGNAVPGRPPRLIPPEGGAHCGGGSSPGQAAAALSAGGSASAARSHADRGHAQEESATDITARDSDLGEGVLPAGSRSEASLGIATDSEAPGSSSWRRRAGTEGARGGVGAASGPQAASASASAGAGRLRALRRKPRPRREQAAQGAGGAQSRGEARAEALLGHVVATRPETRNLKQLELQGEVPVANRADSDGASTGNSVAAKETGQPRASRPVASGFKLKSEGPAIAPAARGGAEAVIDPEPDRDSPERRARGLLGPGPGGDGGGEAEEEARRLAARLRADPGDRAAWAALYQNAVERGQAELAEKILQRATRGRAPLLLAARSSLFRCSLFRLLAGLAHVRVAVSLVECHDAAQGAGGRRL